MLRGPSAFDPGVAQEQKNRMTCETRKGWLGGWLIDCKRGRGPHSSPPGLRASSSSGRERGPDCFPCSTKTFLVFVKCTFVLKALQVHLFSVEGGLIRRMTTNMKVALLAQRMPLRVVSFAPNKETATKVARVRFSIKQRVQFGQSLAVVGSKLGGWDTKKSLVLQWNPDDVWLGEAECPCG
jgi:hypothetical protein